MLYFLTIIYIVIYKFNYIYAHIYIFLLQYAQICIVPWQKPKTTSNSLVIFNTQKSPHPEIKINLSFKICWNYMPIQYYRLSFPHAQAAFGPVPPRIVQLFLLKYNVCFC